MEDYIETTLGASEELLTVIEFIKVTEFPIDAFMIDRFWNTMEEDRLIYVDDELISWMGYNCASLKDRKKDFVHMLLPYICGDDYYNYTNTEYKEFLGSLAKKQKLLYPPAPTARGSVNTKHLLVTPSTLKSVALRLSTKRGNRIRKHFVSIDNLIKLYTKYQCAFNKLNFNEKMDQLTKSPTNIAYTKQQEENENEPDNPEGYVYFIKMDNGMVNESYIKIGYSKDVESRLQELQIASPFDLIIEHTIYSDNAFELESTIQDKYKKYHKRGEWYLLPNKLLPSIKRNGLGKRN